MNLNLNRLAFSTNAFKQTDVFDAVRTIASAGYAGVEIMADAPHMRPDAFTDADARQLRDLIGECGLTVSNVNAFTGFCFEGGDTYHPTWVEPDAAERQRRIDHTIRAIELTARIGGTTVSLQPGGPHQGRAVDELYDLFAAGLQACLPAAREHGVTLAIEPEPGLLIERSEQYDRLKRDYFADEPRVRMNCDVGHFFCVREDPAAVIRSHADQIVHLHLEDIGAGRIHQHLVPGEGAMDFPAIFTALEAVNYAGWVTVELYPYVSTAAEVCRRAWGYLGEPGGVR